MDTHTNPTTIGAPLPTETAAVAALHMPTVGELLHRPAADLLTLPEVGAILNVPVNTLRWWRQQGSGPRFFKLGRRLVTTVGELTGWVEEQRRGTHPAA